MSSQPIAVQALDYRPEQPFERATILRRFAAILLVLGIFRSLGPIISLIFNWGFNRGIGATLLGNVSSLLSFMQFSVQAAASVPLVVGAIGAMQNQRWGWRLIRVGEWVTIVWAVLSAALSLSMNWFQFGNVTGLPPNYLWYLAGSYTLSAGTSICISLLILTITRMSRSSALPQE